MTASASLATVALIWFAACVVPGPDFLLLSRIALRHARPAGMQAAIGIACGITLWGLAGFFGIHALFAAAPWLYLALKLGGGAYLVFLGARLLLGSFAPGAEAPPPPRSLSRTGAFAAGLATNLANPKAALFTTSLFAAAMPAHPTVPLGLASVGIMSAESVLWYGVVVFALTTPAAAAAFGRARRWIDRAVGAAFVGLGTRLALER
jgi:threonine/homoserine/homoserine lactone efflux protein